MNFHSCFKSWKLHFKNIGCNTERSNFTGGGETTQMLSATWSSENCPCPWQGIEMGWSLRPLQTQTILWFCDMISVYAAVLRFGYKWINLPDFCRGTKDMDEGRGSSGTAGDTTEAFKELFIEEAWPVNLFLWDVFSLFPDTLQRSKFYYEEKTT